MVLAFQGSRVLDGDQVTKIIAKEVKKHNPDYVVTSGEATGVCAKAREYCEKNGISLKLHFLNKRNGRGQYHHRSVVVMTECDYCVFIHDGKSIGTKNEMKLAEKFKKPNKYYLLKDESAAKLIIEPVELKI